MSTYATQIDMSLAGHSWEVEVEVTYRYDAADQAHGSRASVEVTRIVAEDPARQIMANRLPQAAIDALESEILDIETVRKLRCRKGSPRRSAP